MQNEFVKSLIKAIQSYTYFAHKIIIFLRAELIKFLLVKNHSVSPFCFYADVGDYFGSAF